MRIHQITSGDRLPSADLLARLRALLPSFVLVSGDVGRLADPGMRECLRAGLGELGRS